MFSPDDGVSFVVTAIGRRDSFLGDELIPAVRALGVPRHEIVIVGRYGGRGHDRIVALEEWPRYFYKPAQQGILAARHPWVVLLDDDMIPAPDWWAVVCREAA